MEQKPLDRLRCVVERITYQSDGYSVLKCAAKGHTDLVAVVGMMPDTHVGSNKTLSLIQCACLEYVLRCPQKGLISGLLRLLVGEVRPAILLRYAAQAPALIPAAPPFRNP